MRFVASRSAQQSVQAKRYEFDGVSPWLTDDTPGSTETRVGREQVKVKGEGEQWLFPSSSEPKAQDDRFHCSPSPLAFTWRFEETLRARRVCSRICDNAELVRKGAHYEVKFNLFVNSRQVGAMQTKNAVNTRLFWKKPNKCAN